MCTVALQHTAAAFFFLRHCLQATQQLNVSTQILSHINIFIGGCLLIYFILQRHFC